MAASTKLPNDIPVLRYTNIMSDKTRHSDHDHELVVDEAKPRLKRPPMYKVVMLNDDYTPMEFVVMVLQTFFQKPREQAVQIMLEVHTRGKAVAGVFTAEIAETKVAQVNEFARKHQHPLLCTMERA